jgi:acyl-[acyl carrier protein]--UDP-N-acetylglucosamine O-acyltransferase
MGSNEYGNYVAGLQGLSGQGLGAVESGNNTTAGLTTAGNNALLAGTQAQGNFNVAGANALGAGLTGVERDLVSLGSYGGSGGKFGLPGFA